MDKNFILLGIGFIGGITLTNIGFAYGRKKYYEYKYRKIQEANSNRKSNNQNNQISQSSQNK